MFKAKPALSETQVRFARFLVVGLVSYGVQVLVIQVASSWLGASASFILSFVISTLVHYALNRFWALASFRTDRWRQLQEYLASSAMSFVISFSIFHLCLNVFGFSRIWSTAIAVPPSTAVVFLMLNYRVFRARSR